MINTVASVTSFSNDVTATVLFSMPNSLPLEQMQMYLAEHFSLTPIERVTFVEGGYQCSNFAFVCQGKRFFLKQYREDSRIPIDDVKRAEQFFSDHHIPVVMPIPDRQGRVAFEINGSHYSLFPFVDAVNVSAHALSPHHIASLGILQAKMHQIGMQVDLTQYPPVWFWDREAFLRDVARVEEEIDPSELLLEETRLAYENLQLQAGFVRMKERHPNDYGLACDCLLHGDFIYTNVFFTDRGDVASVYDFEQTRVGPRAYDLARSVFITCFDDGWHEKNFEFAAVYLKAYQTIFPISKQEFTRGVHLYTTHYMYMSWLEKAVLLAKSDRHHPLVAPAHARLRRFLGDLDHIINRIYVT